MSTDLGTGQGLGGEPVIVVSGLPRSGTSMMMQMLEAGGVEPLTDRVRAADEDNLRGYYEWERAKRLPEDTSWLDEARGKAVKIISELVRRLPPEYAYRIIFMRRDLGEVLASQQRMLSRRGVTEGVEDRRMAAVFEKHLAEIQAWLSAQPNIGVLYADYGDVLRHTEAWGGRLGEFLGRDLDVPAMVRSVDGRLYRQRKGQDG